VDEISVACSIHRTGERFIQKFVGNPEGKRPLGRPRHRWDWILLAEDKENGESL